jgi:hypothetical protein
MTLSGEHHALIGLPLENDIVRAIVMDAKYSSYPVWTLGENKDPVLQDTVAPSNP